MTRIKTRMTERRIESMVNTNLSETDFLHASVFTQAHDGDASCGARYGPVDRPGDVSLSKRAQKKALQKHGR